MTTADGATSISLERLLHLPGTSVRSLDPLVVETSPGAWTYALALPLVLDELAPHLQGPPATITVRVTVESGELGCLLVGSDWTTILGHVPPAVGKGRHVIRAGWEHGGRHANLVFRNARADNVPCVFHVDSVHLGDAPARLPAPLTRLQFVTDSSSPDRGVMRLTGLRDAVQLHNAASATGEGLSFVTDPAHWSYSVSIPIDLPAEPDPGLEALLAVDVHVLEGAVGVGVVKDGMNGFLSPEVDVQEARGPARVELRTKSRGTPVHLMFRNSRDDGTSSRFALLGITLQSVPRLTTILDAKALPRIDTIVHEAPPVTGVFDVLVSHTSRRWVAEQCDRGYLRERWARPERLRGLPPFDTLPPHSAPYYGLLSVLRIELSANGVTGRLLRYFASREKVVHAAVMGSRVVVAFDDGVALFDGHDGDEAYLDPDSGRRIADPWFGGLHTVIPVDGTTCLISSSGADAVLWLDTARAEVIRRWRLPAEQYGTNYPLDQTTSLVEHYVANDFQLGHLNCAAPDGRGGVYVSVLGQGDIGHLRASGEYERIATDFVGCHGVRFAEADNLLYFSDSCSGRLMRVDGRDRATVLFETGSRWLHDAVQLTPGLFLMTVGDRNRLLLGDVARGRVLAEWDFSAAEGTVQFLSVAARRS
jgi:hypothetical protein